MKELNSASSRDINEEHRIKNKSATTATAAAAEEETKMADKIDHFLQTVKDQQQALAKMLEQRKIKRTTSNGIRGVVSPAPPMMMGGSGTFKSTASNVGMNRKRSNNSHTTVNSKVNSWISRPPNMKSFEARRNVPPTRSAKMNSIAQNNASARPSFNPEQVTSKLKEDRNYQPPRRKAQQQQPQQHQPNQDGRNTFARRQENARSTEEYNDDFELEDDEDDDDDCNEDTDDHQIIAKKKEAWLYDQAIRGRARQKAAEALKMNQKMIGYPQEKESSKDSAYGFSGGENSRLHTREPTPDTNNCIHPPKIMIAKNSQSRISNHTSKIRNSLNNSPSTTHHYRREKYVQNKSSSRSPNDSRRRRGINNKSSPIRHIVDQTETDKVEFLNRVTKEILIRGKYTDKAIKRALESQLNNSGNSHLLLANTVTLSEKSALINKLKIDLGLVQQEQQPSVNASGGGGKTVLRQRSSNSESSTSSPKELKRLKEFEINDISRFDDELKSLFSDDVDLVDIIKSSVGQRHTVAIETESHKEEKIEDDDVPRDVIPGRIMDSLNLTNLNVSFNSTSMAEAKRRLEESRTQALLVKSFAYKDSEKKNLECNNEDEGSEPEVDQDDDNAEETIEEISRSSELYQSEDDSSNSISENNEVEDEEIVEEDIISD